MEDHIHNIDLTNEDIQYESNRGYKKFYINLKQLVGFLIRSLSEGTFSDARHSTTSKIRTGINEFCTTTLPILKKNAKALSEYMRTFAMMIDLMKFIDEPNGKITSNSISCQMDNMTQYHIKILCT